MKLLIGVVVLFGALTLQVLYTKGGLGGGDVGTLNEKLDELQDELGLQREELHGLKLKLLKKSKLIIKLQTDMGKLRSERASTPQLSLNLRKGLLAEKRLKENTEVDLRELKTVVRQNAEKVSALQIDTALLFKKNQSLCQCSTISGKIAGVKGEPGVKGDTGLTGLKGEPGLRGSPGVKSESGEKGDTGLTGLKGEPGLTGSPGQDGLKCDPCMPGLPGQKGEPDRSGENGTRIDPVLPGGLSVPEFRFTRADGETLERVVIEAGGAAVGDGPRRAGWTTVRTDGLLGADRRLYWETRLLWSLVSGIVSSWWSVGGVGVRREGSDFGIYPGADDQSWGVWIRYNPGQKTWRYDCRHGGKSIFFESAPVTATSPSGSHRLGLLLDLGAVTLTAVDVNTNTRLCTFSLPAGDAGSQRLVPLVGFGNSFFERRFSLSGVDPSRLPGAVTDLLQK